MKTIVLASNNPVKKQAALLGFQAMYPDDELEILHANVPSGVSDQPSSSGETLQGAVNRAANALQAIPAADFWIGIEGGIEDTPEGMAAFAWVVVMADALQGKARTGTFFLPPPVARLVEEGKELGEADDIVFGRSNSKQQNGAIGILTGDVIDRAEFYRQAVIMALIPFKNAGLYRS
ncbi:MAG TPA: inosine/xanthosine triphosphatase [Anaerolineaceae bacterium]|nr:inosine/xanthosine triphosphatase [Anaerolineaceae bacterium]HPN52845.1 inosine/xanthosine triphosphatase [Anaerolineaceae bacterium]